MVNYAKIRLAMLALLSTREDGYNNYELTEGEMRACPKTRIGEVARIRTIRCMLHGSRGVFIRGVTFDGMYSKLSPPELEYAGRVLIARAREAIHGIDPFWELDEEEEAEG
jgi:hypothetical protein